LVSHEEVVDPSIERSKVGEFVKKILGEIFFD
jgi:hypothetical protein